MSNTRIAEGAINYTQTLEDRSASFWWSKLSNDLKVQYATECLNKKGSVLRYNNDGLIIGFYFADILTIWKHYA